MRPTIYGRELKIANNGNVAGINLGYNFYSEHEHGTEDLVDNINRSAFYKMKEEIDSQGLTGIKAEMKYKKMKKQNEKILSSNWKNTPFGDYIITPYSPQYIRDIEVRNDDIRNKYTKFLLSDGEYQVLYVETGFSVGSHKKNWGKRRIFNEEELLYMKDYNSMSNNTGFQLRGWMTREPSQTLPFAATWAGDGFGLFMKKNALPGVDVIDQISNAIKRGCLAIVPQENRLFSDRGCCLVVVDVAYGVDINKTKRGEMQCLR